VSVWPIWRVQPKILTGECGWNYTKEWYPVFKHTLNYPVNFLGFTHKSVKYTLLVVVDYWVYFLVVHSALIQTPQLLAALYCRLFSAHCSALAESGQYYPIDDSQRILVRKQWSLITRSLAKSWPNKQIRHLLTMSTGPQFDYCAAPLLFYRKQ